jgi:hypothetical protein
VELNLRDTVFSVARRWDAFWFPVGPPHALAVFRIFFGLFWLTRWISLGHVKILFSEDGLYFPAFPAPQSGIHDFESFIGALTASPSLLQAWTLYLITAALLLFIIVGAFSRIALLSFFLADIYYYYLYFHLHGTSFDRLLLIITFVLFLSPCGAVLSADSWWAKRRGIKPPLRCSLWCQRILCVQVAFLYFGTGIHKLTSEAWKNGDNLAASFYGDYATRLGFWIARLNVPPGVFDVLTIFIVLFELSMVILLFHKRWQKWGFLCGSLFHLANSSILWIPEFLVIIPSYILFIDPDIVRRFIEDHFESNTEEGGVLKAETTRETLA